MENRNAQDAWTAGSVLALVGVAATAFSHEACTTYSVKVGDVLGEIATAAYGTTDCQQVFNTDRDIIAASPNVLAQGTPLILTCLDGPLRSETELSSITPSGLSVVPEMATMIGL